MVKLDNTLWAVKYTYPNLIASPPPLPPPLWNTREPPPPSLRRGLVVRPVKSDNQVATKRPITYRIKVNPRV